MLLRRNIITFVSNISLSLRHVYRQISAMDLSDFRKPYHDITNSFSEKHLISKEPIGQFKHWFDEVCKSGTILEPNAVCLATCSKSGIPSSRMVLLKGFGKDGFKFFTNGCSQKGRELSENSNASLLFYWEHFKRQVRIVGPVVPLSMEEADEYFHRRPRQSQIAAAISKQSSVTTREVGKDANSKNTELQRKYEDMCKEFEDENVPIPKPETWGGYKVIPEVVEFWQGQTNRLHDRIRFRRLKDENTLNDLIHVGEDGWVYERLAP